MKLLRVPVIIFGMLCLGFLAATGASASLLPQKVATHFDFSGQPDGWMQRNAYLTFIGCFGIGTPLFVVGLCYVSRFLPDWAINVPNKHYWLSSARRLESLDFLFQHSLWLGCLILLQISGLHYLTIQANYHKPPVLPGVSFAVVLGAFLAGVAWWSVVLYRHFRRPA